jgi:hypothetical protein
MTVDEDTNDIYFVKCVGISDIKFFDYNNERMKALDWKSSKQLKIDDSFKPRFIRVLNNQIFIVNASSIQIDFEKRILKDTPSFGESYIYILDKNPFKFKLLIDLRRYAFSQPWNLIVDKDLNIYTTVYQINERKYIENKRYLCKFNKSGDLTDSVPLEHTYLSNDMIFVEDKIIFFKENEMIVYT